MWNDQVDFASDYEAEVLPNPLHSAARYGTPSQIEPTAQTGTKPKEPRANESLGLAESDTLSNTVIPGQQELVVPKSATPFISPLRPQRHKNTRLFLSKEVRMLHRHEDEIGTREYRHIAHSSNVLYGSPDLGEGNRTVHFKTSTAMRPERKLQSVDNPKQGVPRTLFKHISTEGQNMRETPQPKASCTNNWNDLSTANLGSSDRDRVRYSHRDTSSESELEQDSILLGKPKDLRHGRTSRKEAPRDRRYEKDHNPCRHGRASCSESEGSYTGKKRTPSFELGKNRSKIEIQLQKDLEKCRKLIKKYNLSDLSAYSDSDDNSRQKSRKIDVPRRNSKAPHEHRSKRHDRIESSDESSETEVEPYRRAPIERTTRVNEDRLLKQIRENLNDYRLVFGGDKKENAEEFLERLDECRELTRASDELWMSSISRIFKGKARVWYKTNRADFHSWRKFKKLFRDQYLGLLDENDLYYELHNKIQMKQETISEYIDSFRYLVSRMSKPPSISDQLGIIYKNLLSDYRRFIHGRKFESFAELRRFGLDWEKEKLIDERQSNLQFKKSDKLAEITENSSKSSRNGSKKGKAKEGQEEIAAVGEQENNFAPKLQANKFPTPNQATSVPQNTAQRQSQGNFRNQRQQGEGWRPQSQNSSWDNQATPQPLQGQIFQLNTIPRSPKDNSGVAQDLVPTAQDQRIPICRKCQQLGHKVTQCPQIFCRTCNAPGHMSWACPENPKREFSCYKCGYPGVIRRNCPKCNSFESEPNQGNEAAGGQTVCMVPPA